MEEHKRKIKENDRKAELANLALDYLRLEEALDRAPTLNEFGKSRFARRAEEAALSADVEAAWARYGSIIDDALSSTKTKKELVRDVESREHAHPPRPHAAEHHATPRGNRARLPDDGSEQAVTPEDARGVPRSETQADPHVAAKKPWGRRLLGD